MIRQPGDIHGGAASFTWARDFARGCNAARQRAQAAVDAEFFRLSTAMMPLDSGGLIGRSRLLNASLAGSGQVAYAGPSARFLHEGCVMVGVDSGSPWARRGEKKVVTARPLAYRGALERGARWTARAWDKHAARLAALAGAEYAKGGRDGT